MGIVSALVTFWPVRGSSLVNSCHEISRKRGTLYSTEKRTVTRMETFVRPYVMMSSDLEKVKLEVVKIYPKYEVNYPDLLCEFWYLLLPI